MARPENPVTADGPVADLARALRRLRDQAGRPDYRALARKAGYSPTTLTDAAAGRASHSMDVALAFAGACDAGPGDLAEIRNLWSAADKARKAAQASRARSRRRTRAIRADADSRPLPSPRGQRPYAGQPQPDPDGTAAQFVEQLRLLRAWSGQVGYKDLHYNAGLSPRDYRDWVPRSTVYDALRPSRKTLPALRVTQVIAAGCHGLVDEWTHAWRAIKVREVLAAQDADSELPQPPKVVVDVDGRTA
jgi:hypothetical protein